MPAEPQIICQISQAVKPIRQVWKMVFVLTHECSVFGFNNCLIRILSLARSIKFFDQYDPTQRFEFEREHPILGSVILIRE